MLGSLNNNIELLLQNNIFLNIVKGLLIYYIIFESFKLNNELVVLFDNIFIKLLIIMLVFYTSFYNTEISILIMLSLLFSLNTLNKHKLNDLLDIQDNNHLLDFLSEDTEINEDTEEDKNNEK